MANNSWQKESSQLTPEERMRRVVKILSEGVIISYIRNKPQEPKEEGQEENN